MNARSLSALIGIAVLAGCGGGSSAQHVAPATTATSQPAGGSSSSADRATATFTIKFPTDFQQAVRKPATASGPSGRKAASVARKPTYINPSANTNLVITSFSYVTGNSLVTTVAVAPDQYGVQSISLPILSGSGTIGIVENDITNPGSPVALAKTINDVFYSSVPAGQDYTLTSDLTLTPIATGLALSDPSFPNALAVTTNTFTDDESVNGPVCASSGNTPAVSNVGVYLADEMNGFTSLNGGFSPVTLVVGSVTGSNGGITPGTAPGLLALSLGYGDGSTPSFVTFTVKGTDAFGTTRQSTITIQNVVLSYSDPSCPGGGA